MIERRVGAAAFFSLAIVGATQAAAQAGVAPDTARDRIAYSTFAPSNWDLYLTHNRREEGAPSWEKALPR